jgi:hypothetical protein
MLTLASEARDPHAGLLESHASSALETEVGLEEPLTRRTSERAIALAKNKYK